MRIHDLINKEFETKDDLVVELAESIREVDDLVAEREHFFEEVSRLEKKVNDLKLKNLELLAMIPTSEQSKKDEVKKEEVIEEREVFF